MAGKHVRVSAEKKSHATKRSFSSSDAKNISQQCQKIQEALNEIAKSDAIYRESIQQETNRYVATQVLKLMEKIPVEEVNRDKHGIRVKALRDSGYVTYADMLTSSIYQLAAIRGISEDGARIIKRIVSEAADKASTTTKLRLSADNRTEDMTRLITGSIPIPAGETAGRGKQPAIPAIFKHHPKRSGRHQGFNRNIPLAVRVSTDKAKRH